MHGLFFNRVTILGVGLLGASFARALREGKLCRIISGYGRSVENLMRAKERGILDDYSPDAREACADSDLIVLATPVGAFKGILQTLGSTIKKGSLVTDVGSVKGPLVYALESLMPEGVHYIGSHPIAGSDKSGFEEARSDLFRNAKCIITPTENSNADAVRKVAALWESFGARVERMDPHTHDGIYAAVSHLPHLVAYALVNTVGDIDEGHVSYAGSGFKDSTRIALSSPALWRDVALLNRENLIKDLGLFRKNLDEMEELLKSSDAGGIEKVFMKARTLREKIK